MIEFLNLNLIELKGFSRMSYVLGVHMGHDASISVLNNGKPTFCLSEERLAREKMYYGFPIRSLGFALNYLNISPDEITTVALDTDELCRVLGPEEISRRFKSGISKNISQKIINAKKVWAYFFGKRSVENLLEREQAARNILMKELEKFGFPNEKIKTYDHHLSHAASAFWPSPFNRALFATCDGRGDGLSGLLGFADRNKINVKHQITELDSVGQFYAAVTFYLGFKPNRHEGKITGLAAYGDAQCLGLKFLNNVTWNTDGSYKIRIPDKYRLNESDDLNEYFRNFPLSLKDRIILHNENNLNNLIQSTNWYSLIAYLEDTCHGETKEDIAAGIQFFAEEICKEFITRNLPDTPIPVVLAGGVYSNVKINQKIREIPGVSNVFIQPAMGDDGLSLGAALLGFAESNTKADLLLQDENRPTIIEDVYLGPNFVDEIQNACKLEGVVPKKIENIENQIANWIHSGKIVAYYHGRMEFGPRALGHRSILASAIDRKINDDLNNRLHRTEFMPFAPSILAEHAHEYLDEYQSDHVASEYMTITYNIPKKYHERIPAVVHVDGTARPQVVHKINDPNYHSIIENYYALSGIPLIINTSYNIHEEPIVCTPVDAIRTFKANAVDILVMEDVVLGNTD